VPQQQLTCLITKVKVALSSALLPAVVAVAYSFTILMHWDTLPKESIYRCRVARAAWFLVGKRAEICNFDVKESITIIHHGCIVCLFVLQIWNPNSLLT
jgi:hypothetical protein